MKNAFVALFALLLLALPVIAGHIGYSAKIEQTSMNENQMTASTGATQAAMNAQQMREKWQEMREKYREAMGEYKEVRSEWIAARQEWMNTKKSGASDEVIVEKAKKVLDRGVDLALKHLEVIKERIENDPSLSEEEKAKISSKLDEYEQWLNQKKEEIPELETKEQLKEKAKEIRNEWQEVRGDVKGIVGEVASAKIEYALNRADKAGEKMETIINKYKEKGYDTTKAEELLQNYYEKLDEAKQKYEELKQEWQEVENVNDTNRIREDMHSYIKEIVGDLKEGYKNLKELVQEVKKLKEEEG